MTEKIEVRLIKDYNGNVYLIYDYIKLNKIGLWRSLVTYDNLGDALKNHKELPFVYNIK